ncbi:hypothetical protein QH639_19325 [Lysinibacillus sp. 1 U-2021]|uniref:hypothetical protein n=1 Tax=Lysinibacillus sp. 1 U-2021 TaxID=3039426 RepID=UPI0024802951|nr:hypothetical protein [Lysinibacillus sp. 1 U-2021]WGT37955.1 hypothetical protein QH639_19325 [Lysinibacillus sp. 1 U-2021]
MSTLMKTFEYVITHELFGDTEGHINAESLEHAIDELKDFYAHKLGIDYDSVNIDSIKEIND